MQPLLFRLYLTLVIALLPLVLHADQSSALTLKQATDYLHEIEGEVVSVDTAEIPGFTRVGMSMNGQIIPLYLDNSGTYLLSGNIIDLKGRKNLTEELFRQLNPIDITQIPLDDALILGRPDAPQRTIVFTDPDCPYCSKLHKVLVEAVKTNPDLSFFIKVTALKKSSHAVAKTILCNRSLEQLEQAFSGITPPAAECETDQVDANIALAQELGIRGTPTLLLPNGSLHPGYRPLDGLLTLIRANQAPPAQ